MKLVRASSVFIFLGLVAWQRPVPVNVQQDEPERTAFTGSKAGDEPALRPRTASSASLRGSTWRWSFAVTRACRLIERSVGFAS
jgi:hypothetical protein